MPDVVASVFLDDWELGNRDKIVQCHPDAVEAVIREVGARWSADLFLLADAHAVASASRWLAVTASSGHYAVAAQLAQDGPWMCLLGDSRAMGEIEFARGGQTGRLARRFCVRVDDAVAVARHYAATAELDPSRRWVDDAAS
jgi:hypothetical protein